MHGKRRAVIQSDSDEDEPVASGSKSKQPRSVPAVGSAGASAKGKGKAVKTDVIDLTGDSDDDEVEAVESRVSVTARSPTKENFVKDEEEELGLDPAPTEVQETPEPEEDEDVAMEEPEEDSDEDLDEVDETPQQTAVRLFLADRETIIMQQNDDGLRRLQDPSDEAVREGFAEIASSFTRTERFSVYNSYSKYCTDILKVPAFPIGGPIVALYLHENDCAIGSVVESLECARSAALDVWEADDVAQLVEVAGDAEELKYDESVRAVCALSDALRFEARNGGAQHLVDLDEERKLRSGKVVASPSKGTAGKQAASPHIASLQAASEKVMARYLTLDGLRPSSLLAAKTCFNGYRQFCATENILPFPLVAEVIAVWILKSDHQPGYAANNLGYLERHSYDGNSEIVEEPSGTAPNLAGTKRSAPVADDDGDFEERRGHKRGKYVDPRPLVPSEPGPNPLPPSPSPTPAPLPSASPIAASPEPDIKPTVSSGGGLATPTPTPGPFTRTSALSLPPTSLPTTPLAITDLSLILSALSPLLKPPAVATALHRFGIDNLARLILCRQLYL
ncbi:hypothetical protein RQP46_011075 [Phenoliferia psychrophenolica]